MLDSLLAPVDIYCERTSDAYWAEPANALSNLAFVVVGLLAVGAARRAGADIPVRLLAWWIVAIGVGSWLFHTHAKAWAALADTLPIWSFVLAYFVFGLRRYFGRSSRMAFGILAAGAVVVAAVMWAIPRSVVEATGGSIQYLPALVALVGFSVFLHRARHPVATPIVTATLVFCVSLFFRSIDMSVCEALPVGTHFLWHLLNAAVLGILVFAAICHGRRPADTRTPGHQGPAFDPVA